jgi:tetratricopeptide (TPR) repeat protein
MPALEFLNTLRRQSLVTTQEVHGEIRWGVLQMVSDFVRETLPLTEEAESQHRHADYYLHFVEACNRTSPYPHEVILTEMENIRVALRFFLETHNTPKALQLCLALEDFWKLRGFLREGREALEQALLVSGAGEAPRALRATGCRLAGVLARRAGDWEVAQHYHHRALDLYRQESDTEGVATTLSNLGVLCRVQGDFPAARRYHEESLQLRRELGTPREIASTLNNLGVLLRFCHEADRAYDYHQESLALCTSNPGAGMCLGVSAAQINLGWTELARQNHAAAYRWFLDGINSCRAYGNRSGIVEGLEGIGAVLLPLGKPHTSALLWSVAARERQHSGEPLAPQDADALAPHISAVRQTLGESTFEEAWQAGISVGLETALQQVEGSL